MVSVAVPDEPLLRRCGRAVGKFPTRAAYDEWAAAQGEPAALDLIRVHGSWAAACQAAGIGGARGRRAQGDARAAVMALQRAHRDLGPHFGWRAYEAWRQDAGEPVGVSTIRTVWGSWSAGVRAARAGGTREASAQAGPSLEQAVRDLCAAGTLGRGERSRRRGRDLARSLEGAPTRRG